MVTSDRVARSVGRVSIADAWGQPDGLLGDVDLAAERQSVGRAPWSAHGGPAVAGGLAQELKPGDPPADRLALVVFGDFGRAGQRRAQLLGGDDPFVQALELVLGDHAGAAGVGGGRAVVVQEGLEPAAGGERLPEFERLVVGGPLVVAGAVGGGLG